MGGLVGGWLGGWVSGWMVDPEKHVIPNSIFAHCLFNVNLKQIFQGNTGTK
jgi:hypothetical protein